MASIDTHIQKFVTYGEFGYVFDESENIIINTKSNDFNKNYVSLPLRVTKYNPNVINKFNLATFTEISLNRSVEVAKNASDTNVTGSNQNVENVLQENERLKNKLNDIINSSEQNDLAANNLAIKQIIIDLRIRLNEGSSENDFSNDFPFLPIK
jgi:hypothetical protein